MSETHMNEVLDEQGKRVDIRGRLIQLGYIVGIALFLAGIIYFFASNWPGFTRWEKMLLSGGLILLFYSLSVLISRLFPYKQYVSELLLFAGCLAFGVGVALIGQIYNSHADSYLLFLIWLVPSLLFCIITRYYPFFILSYVLFHLMVWFYLFPTDLNIDHAEGSVVLKLSLLALINAALFVLAEWNLLRNKALYYLSFLTFHAVMIHLSITFEYEKTGLLFNVIYIPILLALFYYFLIRSKKPSIIIILGFITTIFTVMKFVELAVHYFSEGFFFFVLLFVIGLIIASIQLIKWIQRQAAFGSRFQLFWSRFITALITVIASILATISIIFFVTLVTEDLSEHTFFFLGLIILLTMLLIKDVEPTIRYTLLGVGLLMGGISSTFVESFYALLFIVLLVIGWFMIPTGIRYIFYLLGNGVSLYLLVEHLSTLESALYLITLVNLFFYLVQLFRKRETTMEPAQQESYSRLIQNALRWNSFFYTNVLLFWITFLHESNTTLYVIFNISYFVLLTGLLFRAVQRKLIFEYRVCLVFWFAFLFYKYYDLVWKLLYKSLALILLGLIFLAVSYWAENKWSHYINQDQFKHSNSFLRKKLASILIIIVLQFSWMAIQIGKSEYVLVHGELIKLELQPVDPRSLLQGDYVTLRYSISTIELSDRFQSGERVKVVLSPDGEGVYHYKAVYPYKNFDSAKVLSPQDVVINGVYQAYSDIIYGIEHFFIPEGTGLELENNARYAAVRVSKNGDAIIVGLSPE